MVFAPLKRFQRKKYTYAQTHTLLCSVAQSCLTLCDPMDCGPPGSSVHGILQARVLEWVAIPFSRESSQTRVSCVAGGSSLPEPPPGVHTDFCNSAPSSTGVTVVFPCLCSNLPSSRSRKPHYSQYIYSFTQFQNTQTVVSELLSHTTAKSKATNQNSIFVYEFF